MVACTGLYVGGVRNERLYAILSESRGSTRSLADESRGSQKKNRARRSYLAADQLRISLSFTSIDLSPPLLLPKYFSVDVSRYGTIC